MICLTFFWYLTFADWAPAGPDIIHRVNNLKVRREAGPGRPERNHLLRYKISRGFQFLRPDDAKAWGDSQRDYSRLATTYHHRRGPIGVVMEQFDWFPGPANAYWADARLPASLVGLAPGLAGSPLPLEALVGVWSEPPYAVIGLYAGAMASYARPYQHVHFYDSDQATIALSWPRPGTAPLFTFGRDARHRGAAVDVFHGDERSTLAKRGPHRFYQVIVLEICSRDLLEDVSVNLLTKEGMELLFDKLAPRGILCIHTSNRYVDTVPVIADVADSLGYACRRGHDVIGWTYNRRADETADEWAHYTSEWVMVARKPEDLAHLAPPKGYEQRLREENQIRRQSGLAPVETAYWTVPQVTGRHLWTDRKHDLAPVMRANPLVSRVQERISEFRIDSLWREGAKVLARALRGRAASANNLTKIGVAMHHYHDVNKMLPPAAISGKDGTPLLSWRVALLPYLEQEALYREFKLDEPWDSPHNKKLLEKMPAVYAIPDAKTEPGMTFYQVFTGPGTIFEGPKGLRLTHITDGTSNTILVAEAAEPVPWTKPADLVYDAKKPLPKLGASDAAGFHVLMADGSVRMLSRNVQERILRLMITRADGIPFDLDDLEPRPK